MVLHIDDDEWAAWCIDEAVWMFGSHVEHLVNQASMEDTGKGAAKRKSEREKTSKKVQAVMATALGEKEDKKRSKGKKVTFT